MDFGTGRGRKSSGQGIIFSFFIFFIAICMEGCAASVPVVFKYVQNQRQYTSTLEVSKSAEEIYRIVIHEIEERPDIKIARKDDSNFLVEASRGKQTTTIRALPVTDRRSKVIIAADAGDSWEESKELASRVVARICEEVQMKCQLIAE